MTDPQAIPNAAAKWPDLQFKESALEAAKDADVVLLSTEWAEYREIDPDELVRDAAASCPSEAISLIDADTGQPVDLD